LAPPFEAFLKVELGGIFGVLLRGEGKQVNDVVAVVGVGLLSDFVCNQLSEKYEIIRQNDFKVDTPKAAKFVLVLQDDWCPSDYLKAEEVLQRIGLPWVSGFVLFDEGVVGPLVRPGTPGCSQCVDVRRLIAGRENIVELQMRLLMDGAIPRDKSVSRLGLLQMSYLIVLEKEKLFQGKPANLGGRVHVVDLKTLKSSIHRFLPDPACTICGRLPDDSPMSPNFTWAKS
jgi:ribosomal protein S12 methylthiotransferase accessory factor